MFINSINELPSVSRRAVIINYNTKQVTFLSLLSALRFAGVPVLLVDCHSTDGSFDFFQSVMLKYDFDLISMPLKAHGLTLDRIFLETGDQQILLIDSDLEILDNRIIDFLYEHIGNDQVFGCSFLVGPKPIREDVFKGTSFDNALLYERPFIPLVLFKTNYIKEALLAGRSFAAIMHDNRYARLPRGLKRFVKKLYSGMRKKSPMFFRERYFDNYPEFVYYDTGASIYEYLRYHRSLFLASLPRPFAERYVNHFHGATRQVINPDDKQTGDYHGNMADIVKERLQTVYHEMAEV